MALTKPILNAVAAWDVEVGKTFSFDVIGGNQVVGATLYISDNSTGDVVYTQEVTSYRYEIVVPANASGLVNGTYYNAYLTTTDAGGDVSVPSNTIQFYCYTTPSWLFTNLAQGGVVNNSSFAPTVSYLQLENEPLASYEITLYDASQTEIASSGVINVSSTNVPYLATYTFGGLEDNTVYYVRAFGRTINNTAIETDYIRFTVQYSTPSVYSQFVIKNNCSEGYITYSSNVVLIEGVSNPTPPTFIDNEEVDLRQIGSWVEWRDGFSISGDFTLKAWFREPTVNSTILTLLNEQMNDIEIKYLEDDNNDVYATLRVMEYFIYTPSITKPTSSEMLCLQIRRVSNIYDIKLEVVQ